MSRSADLLGRLPALSKIASWPRPLQIGLAAASIAVIVMFFLWARAPDYRVLFSSLEDKDGGAIVASLSQMNIPYRFTENGSAILVPADRVYEARLKLAEQGLPRGGKTGFELLDQARFGASQFAEQVTFQRALEGELAQSITAVQSVRQARVHLAIPRESLFVRDRRPPTASVLLTLQPGRMLSQSQVSAIAWLVSTSVPNLSADDVSIVDQNGRLLTSPAGDAGAEGARRDLVNDIEHRTVQRILALIAPLVGPGNVRAQASADVDFTEREHTSEAYRPNRKAGEAAVRSEQTSSSAQRQPQYPEGIPGALSNQPPLDASAPITAGASPSPEPAAPPSPGTPADPAAAARQAGDMGSQRHDATINYEVDRTISHVKDAAGTLRRLSVAVVVNYRGAKDGSPQPLPADDLGKLRELAKEAMGFSESRGDTLSIVNSPFSEDAAAGIAIWENPLYQAKALQAGQYLLALLAAFLLWRGVLRPVLHSLASPRGPGRADPDPAPAPGDQAAAAQRASEISRYEDNLNTARSMAEKDPRAVAMVLRSWMEKHGSH